MGGMWDADSLMNLIISCLKHRAPWYTGIVLIQMFAVGLASYFFKEFALQLRIGCAVGFFALFAGALMLYPAGKVEG